MGSKNDNPKRLARKERAQAAKEAKKRAAQALERRRLARKRVLIGTAALTLAAAALSYWVLDDQRLVGVSLLVGGVLCLVLALGALGAEVQPRDRGSSGSIDFGTRD